MTTVNAASDLNLGAAAGKDPLALAESHGNRSSVRRSRIASASGSPNLTLNSINFGPSFPIISPAKSTPRKGVPLASMPCTVGMTISRMTRSLISGVMIGGGE